MGAMPNITSTDQIIGAFGSKTDSISLVQNIASGLTSGDTNQILQATSDAIKLVAYYGDILGKATGDESLIASLAGFATSSNALVYKLKNNLGTTLSDYASVLSSIADVCGAAALKGAIATENPALAELALVAKTGSSM